MDYQNKVVTEINVSSVKHLSETSLMNGFCFKYWSLNLFMVAILSDQPVVEAKG